MLVFGEMHKLSERNVYIEIFFQDLGSLENLARLLQESCKNAIASANFARIEFFVGILQEFLNLQETCKILQEIQFLSTRVLFLPNFVCCADIFSDGKCKIWRGS